MGENIVINNNKIIMEKGPVSFSEDIPDGIIKTVPENVINLWKWLKFQAYLLVNKSSIYDW